MFSGVGVIWIEGGNFFPAIQQVFHHLHALPEGVVLIAHLAFPQAKVPACKHALLLIEWKISAKAACRSDPGVG